MKRRSRRRHKNPPQLTFFLDANVDGDLAEATIRELGHSVIRCRDRFPGRVDDDVVVQAVAREEWVYITRDVALYTDEDQLEMLKASRVRGFLFGRGNLQKEQIAAILEVAIPKICRLIRRKAKKGKGLLRRITPKGELAKL